MLDPKTLDEIANGFTKLLPDGLEQLREDLRKNFRVAVTSALSRMDLVTREEFDVQAAVLSRTRKKLTVLEETVARLEQESAKPVRRTRKKEKPD